MHAINTASMARESLKEEIRTGRYNFNTIQLPSNRAQALCKLKDHIFEVIAAYEGSNKQEITLFYVGKSSVPYSKKFCINNPQETWVNTRIQNRWSEHKKNGYTTMAVIAVVTNDTLPQGIDNAQRYCLSLESELINLFRFNIKDKRLANETSNAGREASIDNTVAYVLYTVMKLEHPLPFQVGKGKDYKKYPRNERFPHSSTSKRRKNCGKCSRCCASDCGYCKHCRDMAKFGGPGKLKQRCIERKCIFNPQGPPEYSQQHCQTSFTKGHARRSHTSTKTYKNKQKDTLDYVSSSIDMPKCHSGGRSETIKHGMLEDNGRRRKHSKTAVTEWRQHKPSQSSLHKQNSRKPNDESLSNKRIHRKEGRMEVHNLQHTSRRKRSRSTEEHCQYFEPPFKRHKKDYTSERLIPSQQPKHKEEQYLEPPLKRHKMDHSSERLMPSQQPKHKEEQYLEPPLKRHKMDHSSERLMPSQQPKHKEEQYLELPLKRRKMDHSSERLMPSQQPKHKVSQNSRVVGGHRRGKLLIERSRPSQSEFSLQYKHHGHSLPQTKSITKSRNEFQSHRKTTHTAVSSNKEHLRLPQAKQLEQKSSKSTQCPSAMEILKKVGKMKIEELVRWIDGLPSEERSRVIRVLKKHKTADYRKYTARSRIGSLGR